MSSEEEQKLRKELEDYKRILATKESDVDDLLFKLNESNRKLLEQETENESLKRRIERCTTENDQLLDQLESLSNSVLFHKDTEKNLREELQILKGRVSESSLTRDNVIEKLKGVSFETRELIETCENAFEESELFKTKTEELEVQVRHLREQNESLVARNQNLEMDMGIGTMEISALREKLLVLDANSPAASVDLWKDDVSTANVQLQEIEKHIKKIISRLNECEQEKLNLIEENSKLKIDSDIFLEQCSMKDTMIQKQNQDFQQMKSTVDEYYSEIVRLDGELKNCHLRVSELNNKLTMINPEGLDNTQYLHFQQSINTFGSVENIENLLSKLEVLQEIEQYMKVNLSHHMESSTSDLESGDGIVTDNKYSAIFKIKHYIEEAVDIIEKLNNKMEGIRNEYESKLQSKSDEISNLKDVLSSTMLYSKILEQILQQYKNNEQLDKAIHNETDELLIVNETLNDGFDTLKHLYRISSHCNSFLYAKIEQLKLSFKLLKEYLRKLKENSDQPMTSSNQTHFVSKMDQVFYLLNEFFEDIARNEPSAQKLVECQQIIVKCEKKLMERELMQNTVEYMSQEVKRLTTKVEHEMTEKIREIEQLKGEIDNVKIDNHELVNKLRDCNHEIISLSTENYDLNEKLENFLGIEEKCEILKKELEKMENMPVEPNQIAGAENLRKITEMCSTLKEENSNLKQLVITFSEQYKNVLAETERQLLASSFDQAKLVKNLDIFRDKCCDINIKQSDLKVSVHQLRDQVTDDLIAVRKTVEAEKSSCREFLVNNLFSMKNICTDVRTENANLKSDVVSLIDSFSNDLLPELNSKFVDCVMNSLVIFKNQNKEQYSKIASMVHNLKKSDEDLRLELKQMKEEFPEQLQFVINDFQDSIKASLENIQSSYVTDNEEIIKEMQEMNLELKKRGETVSNLTQSLSDLQKDNEKLSSSLLEKDVGLSELQGKVQFYEGLLEDKNATLEVTKADFIEMEKKYSDELKEKIEKVKNLCTELESLNNQIRLKDDTISSLKTELSKQREIPDGDVSSVGTISRSEEVSRLKDVEDSFEERYTKLRVLAVKMKKNIAELNQQLKSERAEKSSLVSKVTALTEQAKHIQLLQTECDKLNDDLELKMNEIKELKKIITKSDKDNSELEQKMSEMGEKLKLEEERLMEVQNEKFELETKLKSSNIHLENMKKEKIAEEIVKKEKDKEISLLKQKLKENEECRRKTEKELDEVKQEIRKQGALMLEMQDYEKTTCDLSKEVQNKEQKINELTKKLNGIADSEIHLNERIKQLEDQVVSYIAHNKEADDLILTLNEAISKHERNLDNKESRLKQLTHQLETEKLNNESLLLQLSNSANELKICGDNFNKKEEVLNEQVKVLRNMLTTAEETLKRKECEYDQVKSDFEGYKIRAHSVLQKLKSDNNTSENEEKLKSQINVLEQTYKKVKKQLDDSLIEIDSQKTQLAMVESTKEKLQKRVKELSDRLQAKTDEAESIRAEHKKNKVNSDTLINCFKTENENLKLEIEELKNKPMIISETVDIKRNDANVSRISNDDKNSEHEYYSEHGTMCNLSNGSHDSLESMDEAKTYRRRKHSLIPLDKLLETNVEDNELSENEIELHENVKTLNEQVSYLTNMLNESEKNAARNEQQVSLLKDEIRRLQRMFEREPHLQNTEYLKNVVLKFVSLPLGDEKSRLVAVLETILKLAPNEKKMLQSIAKGYNPDQKQTGGWTSFLGWS